MTSNPFYLTRSGTRLMQYLVGHYAFARQARVAFWSMQFDAGFVDHEEAFIEALQHLRRQGLIAYSLTGGYITLTVAFGSQSIEELQAALDRQKVKN